MSDSLFDILSKKNFDEPAESVAIKRYVQEQFQADAEVTLREKNILVTVAGASLANSLRFRVRDVQKAAHTTKRIVIRIR